MPNIRRSGFLMSCSILLLSGCSIGPGVIRYNMLRYNNAVTDTENEQFLLNLVRLRYRDPPKTIALNNINSQFTVDNSFQNTLTEPRFAMRNVTAALEQFQMQLTSRITDVPTLSMTPQTGADFTKGLVSPIQLERIILLANTGWDLDRLLRLMVHNLNGVENVPHLAGQAQERLPRFNEFNFVARVLGDLQHEGMLELTVDPVPVMAGELSEPFSGEIKAAEVQKAAESHYMFQKIEEVKDDKGKGKEEKSKSCIDELLAILCGKGKDGPREKYILKSTVTAFDLNLASAARGNCDLKEAERLLILTPDLDSYRLIPGDGGHLNRQRQGPGRDIIVGTRSIIGALVFLSKGVEVPTQHYREGLVRVPMDDQGQPFDWTQVTDGLFRVRVQKHRPKNAFVSVKYRGYWFYIEDDDLTTKSSFDLMLEMFNVQIAPGVGAAPLLTISASGPIAR